MKAKMNTRLVSVVAAGATVLFTGWVAADSSTQDYNSAWPGEVRQGHLDSTSVEGVTPIAKIKDIAKDNLAPTEIWRRLEHGERVECLSCIPEVSKLIYYSNPQMNEQANAKTREIATWWLRKRIFGVFGPGQVYEQTLNAATDQGQSETQRAYAVEALGEFLHSAGIKPVSQALVSDPSAKVRKAAAYAMWRLNTQGPNGELGKAIGDADESVRLQALYTATRVHVFTGVDQVALRIDDESPSVRKRAAEALGLMKAKDAVVGLIALTSPEQETDATVRASAVYALGQIADPSAKDAVNQAKQDPNTFVRDAANIAARRL